MNIKHTTPHTAITSHGIKYLVPIILLASAFVSFGSGRTSNGNDFALYLVETKTKAEEKALVEDAIGRPHFFRYLQIMKIETTRENGREGIRITAFEPASYLDICFTVTKPISLRILKEDPVTKFGSAIAVSGQIESADKEANIIRLKHTVVRHKDRLSPALGKELICEVDPRATFYSYTGGKKKVSLTYKDRDLLKHKERILEESGKQGWADFLLTEVAKRNAARARKGQQ
jgi:hypothetical protein